MTEEFDEEYNEDDEIEPMTFVDLKTNLSDILQIDETYFD